jgi:hypothetical protein
MTIHNVGPAHCQAWTYGHISGSWNAYPGWGTSLDAGASYVQTWSDGLDGWWAGWVNDGTGQPYHNGTAVMRGSGPIDLYVYGGGTAVPTNYCASASVLNVDTVTHMYALVVNGYRLPDLASAPPGGTVNFSDCENYPVAVQILQLNSDGSTEATFNGTCATNLPPSSVPPTPTLQFTNDVSSFGGGSGFNITNLFPAGSGGVTLSQLSGEMATLYKGLSDVGGLVGSDYASLQTSLSNLNAHLGSLSVTSSGPAVTITNNTQVNMSNVMSINLTSPAPNVTVTNNFTFTNLLTFTNNVGISNYVDLGGISNALGQLVLLGNTETGQLSVIGGDLVSLQSALSNALVRWPTNDNAGTNPPIDLGDVTNLLARILGTGIGTTGALQQVLGTGMGTTQQLGQANQTLGGMSNLLAQIATNVQATGTVASGSGDLLGYLPASSTNADAATAAATAALGSIPGDFSSATGMVGSAVSSAAGNLTAAGSPSVFSIPFCNGTRAIGSVTLNLDPENLFPGMLGLIKAAWTFIVLILFGRWLVQWAEGIVRTFTSAETGGIPNMEGELAGFGGNVAGVIVAVAVAVAFVILWVVVLTLCTGYVLGQLGLLPSAGSAVSLGGNQGALYLLNASFPVALALGCAGARITIPLAGAKATVIAATASRFLMGK